MVRVRPSPRKPPRKPRQRAKRDTRGFYPGHVKPWVGLVAVFSSCRALLDPQDYDGQHSFVSNGWAGQVIGEPVDGVFNEMWPVRMFSTNLVYWFQRCNFHAFLSKRTEQQKRVTTVIDDRPLAPTQKIIVRATLSHLTALNSDNHKIQLYENDKGIVLRNETREKWTGYIVLLEKTGLCWVEWYKVDAI
jgi:hypothetical protein